MSENGLAVQERADLELYSGYSRAQVDLIKSQIAKGTTDDELRLFLAQARQAGLDPFSRQIYCVVRQNKRENTHTMSIQVSIDGLRLIAERSGKYEGQVGPWWCGPDGEWREVWLSETPPAAARVGVWKRGHKEPTYAVARWASYAQKGHEDKLTPLWAKMPDLMLAKCAESLALRKCFPAETRGLYTTEEMAQADVIEATAREVATEPKPEPPRGGLTQRLQAASSTSVAPADVLVAERVAHAQAAAAEVLAEPAPEGEPKIVTDFYLLAFRERGLTRADVRRLLHGTPDVDDTELLRATLQEYHWPESGASLTRLWKEVVSLRADRERAGAVQQEAF